MTIMPFFLFFAFLTSVRMLQQASSMLAVPRVYKRLLIALWQMVKKIILI